MVCKYFLPFRRLPLHPDCLLCCAEVFYFDIVALVYFCSCCLCFWCSIHGLTEFMEFMDITKTNVMKLAFCNHLCYSERYNETVFLTTLPILNLLQSAFCPQLLYSISDIFHTLSVMTLIDFSLYPT